MSYNALTAHNSIADKKAKDLRNALLYTKVIFKNALRFINPNITEHSNIENDNVNTIVTACAVGLVIILTTKLPLSRVER